MTNVEEKEGNIQPIGVLEVLLFLRCYLKIFLELSPSGRAVERKTNIYVQLEQFVEWNNGVFGFALHQGRLGKPSAT